MATLVLPEIGQLIARFMDSEFYSLHRKSEVLAETPITDLHRFVKYTCDNLAPFQYEASEKNPEPSLNARLVRDAVNRESNLLRTVPNLWLGYNAFNEVLHGTLKKPFEVQKQLDNKVFAHTLQMAN